MKQRFIVLEGPDGVGKTVTANKLAQRTGFLHLQTVPEPYERLKSYFEKEDVDPMSRFLFFCTSLYESGKEIQKCLQREKGIIIDRYTDSLRIYHEAQTKRNLTRILDSIPFYQPDVTIVLTAPFSVLQTRIRSRTHQRSDRFMEENEKLMRTVHKSFEQLRKDYVFDTSTLSVDEIAIKCMEIL